MRAEPSPGDPGVPLRFRTQFDSLLQRFAGQQTYGGSELSECLYAAAHIRDGDLDDWHRAWSELARRVEARAARSLECRHAMSARDAFLRAYTYHRSALAFMDPPTDDRFAAQLEHARSCFRRAAALSDPVIELVDVPFDAHTLPGYFVSAGSMSAPAKTLVVVGGEDSYGEDLYGYVGPAATSRGYNLFVVDLPGQGDLPSRGLVMRPDAEAPIGAALDYVTRRADVDDTRIALLGLGAGGYLAPRAAACDRRVAACVACSLVLDLTAVWDEELIPERPAPILRLLRPRHAKRIRPAFRLLDIYLWRWGVDSLEELRDVSASFVLDPSDIAYPLLNVMTQWEYDRFGAGRKWADATQWWIPGGHTQLAVMPHSEGAGMHSEATNLSLLSQTVFDWLDDVLSLNAARPGPDRASESDAPRRADLRADDVELPVPHRIL